MPLLVRPAQLALAGMHLVEFDLRFMWRVELALFCVQRPPGLAPSPAEIRFRQGPGVR